MTIEEMKAAILAAGWQWLCRTIEEGEHFRQSAPTARYFVHISNFGRSPAGVTIPNDRSVKALGETETEAWHSAFYFWRDLDA